MAAYYNEFDPYAAAWLRNLIAAGHIAPGDVDERSILDVHPDDLRGYTQCHFFAGIGGWSLGARLAGWPDERPLWTGSCPCQPFSVAGKGAGQSDERHLWPAFFALIRARRPDVVMGEQVAAAVGKDWLDGVSADLEGIGYACGAAVVPACAVDAPHRRDRLWFVADSDGRAAGGHAAHHHARRPGRFSLADATHSGRREECPITGRIGVRGSSEGRAAGRDTGGPCDHVADAHGARSTARIPAQDGRHEGFAEVLDDRGDGLSRLGRERDGYPASGAVSYAERAGSLPGEHPGIHRREEGEGARHVEPVRSASAWDGACFAVGADGKARRVGSRICGLVDGLPEELDDARTFTAFEERWAQARAAGYSDDDLLREMQRAAGIIPAPQGPEHGQQRSLQSGGSVPTLPCSGAHEGRDVGHRSDETGGVHNLRRVLQAEGSSFEGDHLLRAVLEGTWPESGAQAVAWRERQSLLSRGISGRVGKLRALGNAIVPQVAAEVIAAYLDTV